MKKTLSIILVALLVISAVPMQSFALFDWIRPKVVKVELVNDVPVSNKLVQNSEPWYGLTETYFYDVVEDTQIYKLWFSNGRSVVIDNYELSGADTLSGVLYAGAVTYCNREECAKAIAEGRNKVNVTVSVVVYYIDGEQSIYTFEVERGIVKEYISSVEFIDSMPENYDEENPEASFVGKKFEIEYPDGSKEILSLEDKGEAGYYLGKESVFMIYGQDFYVDSATGESIYFEGITFNYLDETIILDKTLLPCPYSSYEITDYELNGKAGVTSVTYKLTYKDGRVTEKTFNFDEPVTVDNFVVIDTVDGYDITFGVYSWASVYYSVQSWIGCDIWGLCVTVEGEITDFCDCRCHKDGFINDILNAFLSVIWQIFRINECCQCGVYHW
jgi:hypothetical protein